MVYILYRLLLKSYNFIFSVDVKWLSFAEKVLLLCRLKTLILHRIMVIQLFASHNKLTTYMSVALIPPDIIIYAFFLIWKPWKV